MVGAAETLNFLSNYWTHLLGFFILLMLYRHKLKSDRRDQNVRSPNKDFILCDSPNCVRCTAYAQRSLPVLREDWIEYVKTISYAKSLKLQRISHAMKNCSENGSEITSPHPSFQIPSLERQPFYQEKDFRTDVDLLEKDWTRIYDEYLDISKSITEESGWKTNSTPAGKWSAYYLVNQGHEVEENIRRCPCTFSIVTKLGNFMSGNMFGNACFSVVEPGTHIEAHYGPCNIRARCHLGLDVSEESSLSVDHKEVTWKQGKCLIFDDFFLHSVTHSGTPRKSNSRAIFLVDFWNPNLNEEEKEALSILLDHRKIFRT